MAGYGAPLLLPTALPISSPFGDSTTPARQLVMPPTAAESSLSARNTSPSASPSSLRTRTSRACASCNRQKLRCDGQRPCTRCASTPGQLCEYLPSLRGKTKRRNAAASLGDKNDLTPAGKRGKPTPDGLGSSAPQVDLQPPMEIDMWPPNLPLSGVGERSNSSSSIWRTEETGAAGPTISFGGRQRQPHVSPRTFTLPTPGKHSHTEAVETTSLPFPGDAHNPLAVLAEASVKANIDHDLTSPRVTTNHTLNSNGGPSSAAGGNSDVDGPGGYYAPLERVLKDEAPHIMSYISVDEATQLFDVYFQSLHPHLPLLDREHSSPSAVARRANYLFNAICCVAARASNAALWGRLKEFARFEMERFPKDKNIDVVQAHLIYTMWNLIRPEHFERDMTWIRAGTAVRTGLDINLHRIALVRQAREGLPMWLIRSIVRTWLLSFIVDRTLSAQLGKPSSMRGENGIGQYIQLLLDQEEGPPTADDVWVAALAEWTQILVRAMDTFRSEKAHRSASSSVYLGNLAGYPDLVHVFDEQFRQWRERSEEANKRFINEDTSTKILLGNIHLYDQYARVIVHSFDLQRAMEGSAVDLPSAFAEACPPATYRQAAINLINTYESDIEGPGLAHGCPDFIFTTVTYAAVSLLKATQPQFDHLHPHRPTIFTLARKAADMLARSATVPDHLPANQSVFLSHLIRSSDSMADSSSSATLFPEFEHIDFQAFGQALDQDQTKTLWPPMLADGGNGGVLPIADNAGGGAGDLMTWVAQNQDQDLLYTQDPFWKSILEGSSMAFPSMV